MSARGTSSVGLGRREPCAQCAMPVFLAERLNVGNKLYHRTCFRCARCQNQLSLANCYETETDGVYCCETCPDEEIKEDKVDSAVLIKSVSDEEKTKGLKKCEEEDEYSAFFENVLEEENSLVKARKEFWSNHMLHEADDDSDVVTASIQESDSLPSPDNTSLKSLEDSPRKSVTSKDDRLERKRASASPLEELLKKARSRAERNPDLLDFPSKDDSTLKQSEPNSENHSSETRLQVSNSESPNQIPTTSSGLPDTMNLPEVDDVVLRKQASSNEVVPPLPKSKPPDPASLTTDVNSVFCDVNKIDQQSTACETVDNNVTKDRTSLVKTRMIMFEVPSKNDIKDNKKDITPTSKIEKDIERVSKYFGPRNSSDGNLTKVSSESKEAKIARDIEAVSKYFGPKKVSFRTLSTDELCSDALKNRTGYKPVVTSVRSKSVSDLKAQDNSSEELKEEPEVEKSASNQEIYKTSTDTIVLSESLIKDVFFNDSLTDTSVTLDSSLFETSKEDSSNKEDSVFRESKNSDIKLLKEDAISEEVSLGHEETSKEQQVEEKEIVTENKLDENQILKEKDILQKQEDLVGEEIEHKVEKPLVAVRKTISSPITQNSISTPPAEEIRYTASESPIASPKNDYPEDLNPFGDSEDEELPPFTLKKIKPSTEDLTIISPPQQAVQEYGSLKEVQSKPPRPPQPATRTVEKKVVEAPKIHLNPFWSDGEEPSDDEVEKPVPLPRSSRTTLGTPEPKPRRSGERYDSNSSLSSLNSSKSSTTGKNITPGRKKKPAPLPPASEPGPSKPVPFETEYLFQSPASSTQPSPKVTPRTHRKNRKAPLPPTSTPCIAVKLTSPNFSPIVDSSELPIKEEDQPVAEDRENSICSLPQVTAVDFDISTGETVYVSISGSEGEKEKKDEKNRNRQSQSIAGSVSEADQIPPIATPDKSTFGKWKRRKGPAPSRPVPQRRQIKPLPLAQLKHELDLIELQQQGLEKQGVKLEQLIREKCEAPGMSEDDATLTPEVEELVLELFELVNEKNELFRRQAELMYLRRQQRLEEEYADLEYQIRCLMDQPERNKTDSDKAREEELINRLVQVVERRNEIVECLEMDRVREIEEDFSINSRLNLIASKREEESLLSESPVKLSKKEKKKIKKEKKAKQKGKTDVDKDIDETETEVVKEKKKKKWFL